MGDSHVVIQVISVDSLKPWPDDGCFPDESLKETREDQRRIPEAIPARRTGWGTLGRRLLYRRTGSHHRLIPADFLGSHLERTMKYQVGHSDTKLRSNCLVLSDHELPHVEI